VVFCGKNDVGSAMSSSIESITRAGACLLAINAARDLSVPDNDP
jgi:hypothetical protein